MSNAHAWGPDDQMGAMNHVMQETVAPPVEDRGARPDL